MKLYKVCFEKNLLYCLISTLQISETAEKQFLATILLRPDNLEVKPQTYAILNCQI